MARQSNKGKKQRGRKSLKRELDSCSTPGRREEKRFGAAYRPSYSSPSAGQGYDIYRPTKIYRTSDAMGFSVTPKRTETYIPTDTFTCYKTLQFRPDEGPRDFIKEFQDLTHPTGSSHGPSLNSQGQAFQDSMGQDERMDDNEPDRHVKYNNYHSTHSKFVHYPTSDRPPTENSNEANIIITNRHSKRLEDRRVDYVKADEELRREEEQARGGESVAVKKERCSSQNDQYKSVGSNEMPYSEIKEPTEWGVLGQQGDLNAFHNECSSSIAMKENPSSFGDDFVAFNNSSSHVYLDRAKFRDVYQSSATGHLDGDEATEAVFGDVYGKKGRNARKNYQSQVPGRISLKEEGKLSKKERLKLNAEAQGLSSTAATDIFKEYFTHAPVSFSLSHLRDYIAGNARNYRTAYTDENAINDPKLQQAYRVLHHFEYCLNANDFMDPATKVAQEVKKVNRWESRGNKTYTEDFVRKHEKRNERVDQRRERKLAVRKLRKDERDMVRAFSSLQVQQKEGGTTVAADRQLLPASADETVAVAEKLDRMKL